MKTRVIATVIVNGIRNEGGKKILEFALFCEHILTKNDEHLVAFASGNTRGLLGSPS